MPFPLCVKSSRTRAPGDVTETDDEEGSCRDTRDARRERLGGRKIGWRADGPEQGDANKQTKVRGER